jgi:hypothetical protein
MVFCAVAALQGLLNAWNTTEALTGNWSLQSDPCWSQWHGVSCLQDSVVALYVQYKIHTLLSWDHDIMPFLLS